MDSKRQSGKFLSSDSSDQSNIEKKDILNTSNQTIEQFEDKSLLGNSSPNDFEVFTDEDRELFVIMSGYDFNNFVDSFGHPVNDNVYHSGTIECNQKVSGNNSTGVLGSSENKEKTETDIFVDCSKSTSQKCELSFNLIGVYERFVYFINEIEAITCLNKVFSPGRVRLSKSVCQDAYYDDDDQDYDRSPTIKRKSALARK